MYKRINPQFIAHLLNKRKIIGGIRVNRVIFKKKLPEKEPAKGQIDTDPLRAELYSGEQLAQHAKETATSYRVDTRKGHDRLLPRLDDNEKILICTHDMLNAAIEANRRIAPAGEWLLDNFYLIEEQIRTARRHLPEKFSKELPHIISLFLLSSQPRADICHGFQSPLLYIHLQDHCEEYVQQY